MIQLTQQQAASISSEHCPLRVVNPSTNETFVLLPEKTFERMRQLAYDDSPWTDEEMDLLAAESSDSV